VGRGYVGESFHEGSFHGGRGAGFPSIILKKNKKLNKKNKFFN
jgi:hypothetical protein